MKNNFQVKKKVIIYKFNNRKITLNVTCKAMVCRNVKMQQYLVVRLKISLAHPSCWRIYSGL